MNKNLTIPKFWDCEVFKKIILIKDIFKVFETLQGVFENLSGLNSYKVIR